MPEEKNEEIEEIEQTQIDESLLDEEESSNNETPKENSSQDTIIPEEKTEEIPEGGKQKSLISKILIGVIALLTLLIVSGLGLYFSGFFDEKPKEKLADTKEQMQEVKKVEEKPRFEFSLSDINSKKLNEQLSALTNKNLNQEKLEESEKAQNEKKIIEEQKKKEEDELKVKQEQLIKEKNALEAKKVELEKQKKELEALKDQALLQKEELQNDKKNLENEQTVALNETQTTPTQDETKENKVGENSQLPQQMEAESEFLLLINVAKIKGDLYKHYLDKILTINTNIKLCRDNKNRIEVYIGPFEDENNRNNTLEKLLKNDFEQSYNIELTKEEFDKRCNY